MNKTAIILGATGLTGNHLVNLLLKDNRYKNIKLFSRNSTNIKHPKIEEHLIDLFDLLDYKDLFIANEVYCCVGTTKEKTPDKAIYKKIDYGIPVDAAQLCQENDIATFLVMSALGANPNSAIFYSKTKGKMEEAVKSKKIKKTHIFQPSVIIGNRKEKRGAEEIAGKVLKFVQPLLLGFLKNYRPIESKTIAKAMIYAANNHIEKVEINSTRIKKLGQKYA